MLNLLHNAVAILLHLIKMNTIFYFSCEHLRFHCALHCGSVVSIASTLKNQLYT